MSIFAMVLGMIGMCVCWLPGLGWLGIALCAAGCCMGVVSIAKKLRKPGSTGFGIASVFHGAYVAALGIAFQIKHSQGSLDSLHWSIPLSTAIVVLFASIIMAGLGLFANRKKPFPVFVALVYLAVVIMIASMSSAFVTADKEGLKINRETASKEMNLKRYDSKVCN